MVVPQVGETELEQGAWCALRREHRGRLETNGKIKKDA